jgi:hypothetical protein
MKRQCTRKARTGESAGHKRLWLVLLLLAVLPAAALAGKNVPALVRYIKIERM